MQIYLHICFFICIFAAELYAGQLFCYVFDEEVKLSTQINLAKILLDPRTNPQLDYEDGAPIFMTGEESLEYVK